MLWLIWRGICGNVTHSIAPPNNVDRILCMFLKTTITRSLPSYQPNFVLLYPSNAFPRFCSDELHHVFAYHTYQEDRGPFLFTFSLSYTHLITLNPIWIILHQASNCKKKIKSVIWYSTSLSLAFRLETQTKFIKNGDKYSLPIELCPTADAASVEGASRLSPLAIL